MSAEEIGGKIALRVVSLVDTLELHLHSDKRGIAKKLDEAFRLTGFLTQGSQGMIEHFIDIAEVTVLDFCLDDSFLLWCEFVRSSWLVPDSRSFESSTP